MSEPRSLNNQQKPLSMDVDGVKDAILSHVRLSLAKDDYTTTRMDWYVSTALAVRDRLMNSWHNTQRTYYDQDRKRVYYLSMEFLMGRSLGNSMLNLGLTDTCHEALYRFGQHLEQVEQIESDAGLGNGGLGRLAACFVDSMATLKIPGYGYGLRYEYGIFSQDIVNGEQVENADHWLRFGNVWEIERPENMYLVRFGGMVKDFEREDGSWGHVWLHDEGVMAVSYDTPVPGFHNETVNTLRLWSAKAVEEFNFSHFNEGDYIKAVEERIRTENISRVLYPNDNTYAGRRLRFKQQYFFVSASLQDIIARYKKERTHFQDFSAKVAIQLNDTHPSLAIPELMRILMDVEQLPWDEAWATTVNTFAYTNHTVLPEALEEWPVSLFEEILPRHIEIIYEINRRHLQDVERSFSADDYLLRRMSLIGERDGQKYVRMAYLAIVGSHAVNGVAKLHSDILKNELFVDFYRLSPEKFYNITNGITPRRWLLAANPTLSKLITDKIGDAWHTDLGVLKSLTTYVDDDEFVHQWHLVKQRNKQRLVDYIQSSMGITINPNSLFDVQVKRIHEYKRQILNVMHVIYLYHRIKQGDVLDVPRTFIFGGKAAPGYHMAKLIIHMINAVGRVINSDPDVKDQIKVVFIPNYGVSLAELIIPAADLSEQISTSGMEASGTGNMKFSLNGALTIATLDGANIEITDRVGPDNIFIFGLTAPQVHEFRHRGYVPRQYYDSNPDIKAVLDLILNNVFSPKKPNVFQPVVDELLERDFYLNLVDFNDYVECQKQVGALYLNRKEWVRRCVYNVAAMGDFSSDRAIMEYARLIWGVDPV